MFKINRRVEYALISLKYMSSKAPGQLTSAKEICTVYGVPFDPTSRVLQIMAQKEIIRAEQGAYGGYQVIKDLSKINLGQLTEMIIGPVEIANCIHGNYSHCEITSSCSVIGPMLTLNEKIMQLFTSISLLDLIQSKHSGVKLLQRTKTKEKFKRDRGSRS